VGVRFDANGVVTQTVRTTFAERPRDPEIVFDGTQLLLVWEYNLNHTGSAEGLARDILAARVSSSFELVDDSTIVVTPAPNEALSPTASYNGTHWLVVWQELRGHPISYEIVGTRVARDGAVLDPAGLRISTDALVSNYAVHQVTPSVATNGSEWFVVWNAGLPSPCLLMGGLVLADGTRPVPLSGFGIARACQDAPAVAPDGDDRWLVVWSDGPNRERVLGARVSSNGQEMDYFTISRGHADLRYAPFPAEPSVARGAIGSLVVWFDSQLTGGSAIFAARVVDGAVLDDPAIVVASSSGPVVKPDVAFDGEAWLVAWREGWPGGEQTLRTVRVDSSGALIGAPREVARVPHFLDGPEATFDGEAWLVAWADRRGGRNGTYGVRVGSDGTLGSTEFPFVDPFEASALSSGLTQISLAAGADGTVLATYPVDLGRRAQGIEGRIARRCSPEDEGDADGDGHGDCVDGCPNDALKNTPGACGCGAPDDDSDSDLFPDCEDWCPNGVPTEAGCPDGEGGAGGSGGSGNGAGEGGAAGEGGLAGTGGSSGGSVGGTSPRGGSAGGDGGEAGDGTGEAGRGGTNGGSGAVTGEAGAAGEGGMGATPGAPDGNESKAENDGSGCGCRVAPERQPNALSWLLGFLTLLGAIRRHGPRRRPGD
jgi:uncharacterized membrane protein YgcG